MLPQTRVVKSRLTSLNYGRSALQLLGEAHWQSSILRSSDHLGRNPQSQNQPCWNFLSRFRSIGNLSSFKTFENLKATHFNEIQSIPDCALQVLSLESKQRPKFPVASWPKSEGWRLHVENSMLRPSFWTSVRQ